MWRVACGVGSQTATFSKSFAQHLLRSTLLRNTFLRGMLMREVSCLRKQLSLVHNDDVYGVAESSPAAVHNDDLHGVAESSLCCGSQR